MELDSNGSIATPNYSSSQDEESMPSVPIRSHSTSKNSASSSTPNSNPLHLPEVQDALSSHLQSAQSKWASPTFLNSLSQHPTLSKGWNDPRCLAALESMKTHPKETMEKLEADEPEILNWLMEFLAVMGDHFVMLGEENTEEGTEDNNVQLKTMMKVKDEPKLREMGPLEEKARGLQKAAQPTNGKSHFQQQQEMNSMNDEVTKILSNDALRSILLDPKMQQVMEECARSDSVGAGKLKYYMRHDEFGPKLRELMKAGLLKLA